MKDIIGFLMLVLIVILLLKLSFKEDKDVGGKIIKDIGRTARELKEDFEKGFNEKDSIKIDSLKETSQHQQPESEQP